MRKKTEYKEEEDNIKLIFPRKEMVFDQFHIDFKKGIIYNRKSWDKKIQKVRGGQTSSKLYHRIAVKLPDHLNYLSSKGWVEVLAHRLIFYAYYGFLTEKIDHIDKKVKYQNGISNLCQSDSFHNSLNVKKVKRKKRPDSEKIDNTPSSKRIRLLEEYKGIYFSYGFYWAKYKAKIINENGFISPILAVNCRNKYIIEEYKEHYKKLGIKNPPPFPKLALDIIDENELFLDQMLQEVAEKSEDYKLKHQKIKNEKHKRIEMMKKRKEKNQEIKKQISIKYEDDPFACIGKYE